MFCGGSTIAKNPKIFETLPSSPTCSQSLSYSPWTCITYRTISPNVRQGPYACHWRKDGRSIILQPHSVGCTLEEHRKLHTEELHKLLVETRELIATVRRDPLREWYHDQPISTTTLHDNLKDLGLTYKNTVRELLLNETMHIAPIGFTT